MENTVKNVLRVLGAAGGAVGGMLGGWDSLLAVLMGMMAADYVSGIMVAAMGKSQKTEYGGLSSKVGWIGLAKKGAMMMVVLVATLLDNAIGTEAMCRDTACWFYVANEGISLMENLNLMGVPFPAKIKQLLGDKAEEKKQTPLI